MAICKESVLSYKSMWISSLYHLVRFFFLFFFFVILNTSFHIFFIFTYVLLYNKIKIKIILDIIFLLKIIQHDIYNIFSAPSLKTWQFLYVRKIYIFPPFNIQDIKRNKYAVLGHFFKKKKKKKEKHKNLPKEWKSTPNNYFIF